ncbi:hypothetical protein HGRIS_012818 [Hohenbuehelia grisea]|uniref:CTLH domain-containing protein n=1 Tax=Hohenbuehelia grisea TaxID=104357 RepID=A0ABR3ITJ3_9AGAR
MFGGVSSLSPPHNMEKPLSTLLAPENMKSFTTTPYQLRGLVLDYLCDNGFSKTAKAFAEGMAVKHIDADGDEIMEASARSDAGLSHLPAETLRQVELREEIRDFILSGRVDDAISAIEQHFPTVLNTTTSNAALDRAVTESGSVEYISPTSANAAHISLNLRVLAFIEACRTVPLPYPPPGAPGTSPVEGATAGAVSKDILFTPADPADIAQQEALLIRAQKLYAYANTLPNASDRATFLKELANVGGLLAYKYPEGSPMRIYLSQERREAVAGQVNRAILHRLGRPPVPLLELYLRQTWIVWTALHEHHVKFPPDVLRQAGITSQSEGDDMNVDKDRDPSFIPELDLRAVLDIKP